MFIMLADIRSFAALPESISSEEGNDFLKTYIEPVVELNHGFIDKLAGDAIIALFPETANQAVNAAINLLYNKEMSTQVNAGFGIHAGDVDLAIANTGIYSEATVSDDALNIVSQLGILTEKYQASILISECVYNALHNKQQFLIRVVGLLESGGKKQSLLIYEIFDANIEELKLKKQQTAPLLEQAVGLIMVGKRQEAKRFLEQCLQYYPEDAVSIELLAPH